jgi:hypothetical protein
MHVYILFHMLVRSYIGTISVVLNEKLVINKHVCPDSDKVSVI